jgi:hypothetical protein
VPNAPYRPLQGLLCASCGSGPLTSSGEDESLLTSSGGATACRSMPGYFTVLMAPTSCAIAKPIDDDFVALFRVAGARIAVLKRVGGWSAPGPVGLSRYSITSSACASSVGGTSMPSALAVARLITNSNLTGHYGQVSDVLAIENAASVHAEVMRPRS